MQIEHMINSNSAQLNENDIHILNIILENKEGLDKLTITEIARLANTSTTSIYRTVQRIGFSGFSEFKYYLKNLHTNNYGRSANVGTYKENLKHDLSMLLKNISDEEIEDICHAIYHAKNIYGYGTGWKQAALVKSLGNDFVYYGRNLTQIRTVTDLQNIVPILTKDDMVLIISLSGNTQELEVILKQMKVKGVQILAITPGTVNLLSSHATFSLYHTLGAVTNDPHMRHWSTINASIILDYLLTTYAQMIHENRF